MPKVAMDGEKRISAAFKSRINTLIEEADMTKKEFGKRAGLSNNVINLATLYGIIPSMLSLEKIADMLDIPLEYLLGTTDERLFVQSEGNITFHQRIEELMTEKEVKPSQVAHDMPFPENYFYDWKREGTVPSLEYLRAIAAYFNVSIDYLLGRTDYRD